MKPVLPDNKVRHRLWILYAIIFIICTAGIGMALYLQYYQEQNIGLIFGITDKDSEEEDEYNELKSEFSSIFTNQVENLQNETINVEKINDDYDVVVTAYSYTKDDENCTLNVSIPYINIRNEITIGYNQEIRELFRTKAEELMEEGSTQNVIYNVRYKAYVQNNIISLVIEAELKEGTKSQKIMIKTYNYNYVEQKEVTLEELLEIKDIKTSDANNQIKKEIKKSQKDKEALSEVLAEQGYTVYQRDYNSDIYLVENTENYFLGQDGMLYIIYAYGNNDDTNEMDIIIFR